MSSGPLHKSLWWKLAMPLGINSSQTYNGKKTLKNLFYNHEAHSLYIFSIKQCLVVLYINCANHADAPGVQIGHIHKGLEVQVHYSLKI